MNNTPTPRTDTEHAQFPMGGFTLDFARQLERELTAAREDARWLESIMVRLYNQGYHAGHEDTVEACFTPIHHTDMDAYHADVVAEILQENAGGMARELAAQDSDNSNDLNG